MPQEELATISVDARDLVQLQRTRQLAAKRALILKELEAIDRELEHLTETEQRGMTY